jgi:hypothetical protein
MILMIFLILVLVVSVHAQDGFLESQAESYTKVRVGGFVGFDMAALSDGWNLEMGIGVMGGLSITPQKIYKITDQILQMYRMHLLAMGLRVSDDNLADLVTEAYFESGPRISFGIQSGKTTAGSFLAPEEPGNWGRSDRILHTVTYVPVLASFQHIFWVSSDPRHLYTEIISQEDIRRYRNGEEVSGSSWQFTTNDLYAGYRVSAGPAMVDESDYGEPESLPINVRVGLLLGGMQGALSWLNVSLFYDALFIQADGIDNGRLGRIGMNWAVALYGRSY